MFWRLVKIGAWFQLFSLLMIQWVWSCSIWWGVNLMMTWGVISVCWISLLIAVCQGERPSHSLQKEIH